MESATTLVNPVPVPIESVPSTYKLSFWRSPRAHDLRPIPLHRQESTTCQNLHDRRQVRRSRKNAFLYALPKLSLIEVLQNKTLRPVSLAEYRQYLESVEHGSENLDFYLAVQEVHVTADTMLADSMIRRIVARFIQAGSICEINIDHATRTRIIDAMLNSPSDCSELDVAQAQCFDLMRDGSFPRFLHVATYKNIGRAEVSDRLNMAVLGLVLCVIWIPLALTKSWFERRYRWLLILPIILFFAGIVASSRTLQLRSLTCASKYMINSVPGRPGIIYALLGLRSLERYNLYGLLRRKDHSAEAIEQPCVRQTQRRKALIVWLCGVLPVSCLLTLIIWAIPVNVD